MDAKLNDLPQDREALEAILRALILERDQQSQRAEQESKRANDLQGETLRQRKRADELHLENLRLQLELQRLKKWYYGPRADQLASSEDLAQALQTRRRMGTGALGDSAAESPHGPTTSGFPAASRDGQYDPPSFRPILARAGSDSIVLRTPRL